MAVSTEPRIDDLFEQIKADRAVGLGTLRRRYNVASERILNWLNADHRLGTSVIQCVPVRNRESTRGSYVIAHIGRRPPTTDPSALCHLAYIAELRRMLGATPESWHHAVIQASDGEHTSRIRPDAYWDAPKGRQYHIEIDIGTYTPKTRYAKVDAAISMGRHMIWGAPHHRRLTQLQLLAANLNERNNSARGHTPAEFRAILVEWHMGSEARA